MVGIHYRAGYLIIDCWDDETVEWLTRTAREIGAELNSPTAILLGEDIPKEATMSIWLPKAHLMTEEVVLGTIQGSNPVDTKSWRIVKCAISGPGRILVAKINPAEQLKIASRGNKITFRFKRLDVHGLKGSISQEAKPVLEQEAECSAELMQGVDLAQEPAAVHPENVNTEESPRDTTTSDGTAVNINAGITEDEEAAACHENWLLSSQPTEVSDGDDMDYDPIV